MTVNTIEEAHTWLARFEQFCREPHWRRGDAGALFITHCIGFGLFCDGVKGLEEFEKREWAHFRDEHKAFTFDVGAAKVIPEGAMVCIAVPWISQSPIIGAPDRRGRATFILLYFSDTKTPKCVHLHMSLNTEK